MKYSIFLDEKKIGTSQLEKADAPMGIVFGEISFVEKDVNFDFFYIYCKRNSIEVDAYPEDKLITTRTIPNLKVYNENGVEINGIGCYIVGMDSEGFEINIEGIPYPFYENEFPDHVKAYKEQFE